MARAAAAAGVPAPRHRRRRRGRPRTRWRSAGCSPTGWPRTTGAELRAPRPDPRGGRGRGRPARRALSRRRADGARRPRRRRPPATRRRRWRPPRRRARAGAAARRPWPACAAGARLSPTRWPGSIQPRRAATATPGSCRAGAPPPAARSWPTTRTCSSSCPSVWYEMHLVAAGLDVQGVTVPGTPFVAIGHNARIAWGFTNTGADVQDFVVERIDTAGRRVQTGSGWQPVQVEEAPIPVRGRAEPAPFQIWRTPLGRRLRRRESRLGDAAGVAVPGRAASGGAARAGAQVVGLRDRRLRRRLRGRRSRRQLGGVPGRARPALGAVAERALCRRRRQHRLPDDRPDAAARQGRRDPAGQRRRCRMGGRGDRLGPAAAPQSRARIPGHVEQPGGARRRRRSSPATGRRRSAPPA